MTAIPRARRLEPALCGSTPYHPINDCRECRVVHKRMSRDGSLPMRQPRPSPRAMPTKNVGPPCPECGDTSSRSRNRGWSEPDDNFLRHRSCDNCGIRFVTAEVVVPTEETTFYRLDYRGREWRRENWRAKHSKTSRRLPIQHSDQLFIKVRVQPNPALERNICLRGHAFTPENTYTYPNGNRACRICRRAAKRAA